MVFTFENDRHSVMNVGKKCISRSRNDRTRFDKFSLRVLPAVPDSSERKDRIVRESKAKGRPSLAVFRPFIKAVGGNKQRRDSKDSRKAGFSAIVSALALIILYPALASFAQKGHCWRIRPTPFRKPLFETCPGEKFEIWTFDPMVPNHERTNSKCFIWCRLGNSVPFFSRLVVPNLYRR